MLTPVTIHLMLGADGFHRYPGADGRMLGKGSLKDAHILANLIGTLPPGAVLVACHRDATLHQVVLNAYALARNLNRDLRGIDVVSLGCGAQRFEELPDLGRTAHVEAPLELIAPLLVAQLFTLIE
jgi:hypothetical protein